MIQRIQHLYLFINFLLASYFATMPIIQLNYIFKGHAYIQCITATDLTMRVDGGSLIVNDTFLFPLITICTSLLLSFVGIFQFRNRKLQRGNCFLNYLFIILFILSIIKIWMGIQNIDVLEITTLSWINIALMILMLVLNYFTVAGINRDEALVRSADRLR
ncbi:MAG: DUF4293 family protein [Bacteroidota bacterium]|nr:DUF4293 family protein [Bacteroidota bacterium]